MHLEDRDNNVAEHLGLQDYSDSLCSRSNGDEESEHQDGSSDSSGQPVLSDIDAGVDSSDVDAGVESGGDEEIRDSDEGSDNGNEDPFSDHLYTGCSKTTNEAIHELITIYMCHNLTQSALKDILKLYNSSLPPYHSMPLSHHLLLKRVNKYSVPLFEVEHYYCRPAMHSVQTKEDPCKDCGSTDIGVFYELPLEKRLKFLFEHRGLADLIDKYSTRRRQRRGNSMSDILDGSEYKRVWEVIVTVGNTQYKLTLILITDGVTTHKSSKAKFWPLLITFMEIPSECRAAFTIVWGLWFDKKLKPNINIFLKSFVNSLIKIAEDGGVTWQHPQTKAFHQSPVLCPFLIADAPARASCLNMQEHQSKYACSTCVQKTKKLPPPPVVPGQKQKKSHQNSGHMRKW